MSPLAHVGHWAVNLLYVAPVLLALVVVLVAARLRPPAIDEEKDGAE